MLIMASKISKQKYVKVRQTYVITPNSTSWRRIAFAFIIMYYILTSIMQDVFFVTSFLFSLEFLKRFIRKLFLNWIVFSTIKPQFVSEDLDLCQCSEWANFQIWIQKLCWYLPWHRTTATCIVEFVSFTWFHFLWGFMILLIRYTYTLCITEFVSIGTMFTGLFAWFSLAALSLTYLFQDILQNALLWFWKLTIDHSRSHSTYDIIVSCPSPFFLFTMEPYNGNTIHNINVMAQLYIIPGYLHIICYCVIIDPF